MGTITKRKRADGSIAYRYEIRIKHKGEIIYQESETFDQRQMAKEWGAKREEKLKAPGGIQTARSTHNIEHIINWYVEVYGNGFGRTKLSHLKFLKKCPLAKLSALRLTAQQLIDHVRERRKDGTGPSTVNNDLVWLKSAFKAARPALDLDLKLEVIADAAAFCREQKLIGKSRWRDRRPTEQELALLRKHFSSRDGRARIPMLDIMEFARESSRREEEITLLRWSDNNEKDFTGIVRDAKHPTAKEGNHKTFKYTLEAWEIMQRQPKISEYIFPYKSKSIGAAFTRACKLLGIIDLVFHDMRHEATSGLFERGYSIQEVQQFTLHESWATLQRYTHLRPKNVKHR